jgi:hypothetical protein
VVTSTGPWFPWRILERAVRGWWNPSEAVPSNEERPAGALKLLAIPERAQVDPAQRITEARQRACFGKVFLIAGTRKLLAAERAVEHRDKALSPLHDDSDLIVGRTVEQSVRTIPRIGMHWALALQVEGEDFATRRRVGIHENRIPRVPETSSCLTRLVGTISSAPVKQ